MSLPFCEKNARNPHLLFLRHPSTSRNECEKKFKNLFVNWKGDGN